MQEHIKGRARQIVLAALIFFAVSVLSLWSWNTLAELFSWPMAQYKHVLAALVMLLSVKLMFFHQRQHHDENETSCSH